MEHCGRLPIAAAKSVRSQSSKSRDKVRAHRERLRRRGLRPIQIWVPDVRLRRFAQAEAASRLETVRHWFEAIDLILLRPPVLSRASEPLPTPLRTLDAVHLATALVWRDRTGSALVMATHDSALGLAARTFGFEVRGI
jgi:predicted nucleic acid-binding protein